MQIALYPRPEKDRLLRDLQAGLGREWQVRFFGFGRFKTIIASRSPLHAVQISYSGKHEVQVEGTYAYFWSALLATVDSAIGTGVTSMTTLTEWQHMEQEIMVFLKGKYRLLT
jgi:hypothetical protein